jgi:hypothetical protein
MLLYIVNTLINKVIRYYHLEFKALYLILIINSIDILSIEYLFLKQKFKYYGVSHGKMV